MSLNTNIETLKGASLIAQTLISSINHCQITHMLLLNGYTGVEDKTVTWEMIKGFIVPKCAIAAPNLQMTVQDNVIKMTALIPKAINPGVSFTGAAILQMGNLNSNMQETYIETTSGTETVLAIKKFVPIEKPTWRSFSLGWDITITHPNW